jgi:hypothetical protein
VAYSIKQLVTSNLSMLVCTLSIVSNVDELWSEKKFAHLFVCCYLSSCIEISF